MNLPGWNGLLTASSDEGGLASIELKKSSLAEPGESRANHLCISYQIWGT